MMWQPYVSFMRKTSLQIRKFRHPDNVWRSLMSQITHIKCTNRFYGVVHFILPHSLVQSATKLKIHWSHGLHFTKQSHFFHFIPKKKLLIEIGQSTWFWHRFTISGRNLATLLMCPRCGAKCPRCGHRVYFLCQSEIVPLDFGGELRDVELRYNHKWGIFRLLHSVAFRKCAGLSCRLSSLTVESKNVKLVRMN